MALDDAINPGIQNRCLALLLRCSSDGMWRTSGRPTIAMQRTMMLRTLMLLILLTYSHQGAAESYLLVKLNSVDGKRLPTLLALQSRKAPKDRELSKEVLKHRGRHVKLTGDLSLIVLEPGWYQLVHFDVTRMHSDPDTRYIDFVQVNIKPNTVTYFGDFDLLENFRVGMTFRDTTISEACVQFPEQLAPLSLVVPHFTKEPIIVEKPCG